MDGKKQKLVSFSCKSMAREKNADGLWIIHLKYIFSYQIGLIKFTNALVSVVLIDSTLKHPFFKMTKKVSERERKKMPTKTFVKSWYCNLFTVGYLRRPPLFLNGLNPHFSNGILNLLFIIRITKPLDPVTVDWSNYGELKALQIICGREREKKRNQRKKECVVSHFNWALNGILHSVMRCSFEYG